MVISDIIQETNEMNAIADANISVQVNVTTSSLTNNNDIEGTVEFQIFYQGIYNPDDDDQDHVEVITDVATESFMISISSDSSLTNTIVSYQTILNSSNLWSVEYPNLYILQTIVKLNDETIVDELNTTFGIRKIEFDNNNGFYLNDMSLKIKGCANHQDYAGLGVAVPDHLQDFRVQKLQQLGGNAWRTAHNAPNEALLYSTDKLGMLVWDENHRNGQTSEAEVLVLRDRNHPSIIIWSICNEVLCDTGDGTLSDDSIAAANLIKETYEFYDPLGQRPVSANQNAWVIKDSVLDLLGYDYATDNYDRYHGRTPTFPAISSETSSAVSDRCEYENNETSGHVTGYDTEAPSWGQTAEQAWGGIDEPHSQGILTRDFMSGGFVWTGFDYKGEPTPYEWPDINSHFGILDIAGFEKDRAYWYKAWWKENFESPTLYVFPHWNWDTSSSSSSSKEDRHDNHLMPCSGMCKYVNDVATVEVWVFSEADQVELFLNDESLGVQDMPTYAHVNWTVPYTPGKLEAYAYSSSQTHKNQLKKKKEIDKDSDDNDDDYLAYTMIETTGEPYRLKASFKDMVGMEGLSNDGSDVALIQVAVLDSEGRTVPTASNTITFTIQSDDSMNKKAFIAGTGNGDPADHTNDKSTTRPAYHGLVLGIVQAVNGVSEDGDDVVVSVSSEGLLSDTIQISIHETTFQYQRI
jgi:beta-galactosidase